MKTANVANHNGAAADFDTLFRQLTETWWAHQILKAADASVGDLAASNSSLFNARMAMGSWRRSTRS